VALNPTKPKHQNIRRKLIALCVNPFGHRPGNTTSTYGRNRSKFGANPLLFGRRLYSSYLGQYIQKSIKDLDTRLGGDQQDGFGAELSTFGRDGVVLGPIVGAFG